MDKMFKVMADANRRKILTILKERGPLPVKAILLEMKITQATVSNHLAILKKSGLLICQTRGQQRIYEVNYPLLNEFVLKLNEFVNEERLLTIGVRQSHK